LDIDALCDVIGTRPDSSSGYQDNDDGEGTSEQPNNEERSENSTTTGATEPGMQTKTPKSRGRRRKNSNSTPSTSSISTSASDSIAKALQDFGDIAKKQSEAFTIQQQVMEQQRVLAVKQSKAAIERDSVSALRELFLLQKEVDTTLSDARLHSSVNLTTEGRNRKRK
jgi:hypothetical protein